MRAGKQTKTKHPSASGGGTVDELHLESSRMAGIEQEECSQIFRTLRTDPKRLMNTSERNAFMVKIGSLRDKLNQKQSKLQETLVKALNVKDGPIGLWIGPRISLKEASFPFSVAQIQKREVLNIKSNLENLEKAGCSIRKIQEDGLSLFRAVAFGLLEKGVDMRPHFLTHDFFMLSTRTQRLLKESFERIRKNPTILQLEMEMNVQEISNAWVVFLRQMAQSREEIFQKNACTPSQKQVGKCEKSDLYDIKSLGNLQSGFPGEAFAIDVLSKQFNVPMQVVNTHCQMPRLEKNAIFLLKTPRQIDLLYL